MLKLKLGIDWILLIVIGGDITQDKFCLDLPSSSTNKGSTVKYICPVILSVRILWFWSKGRLYELSRSSTPLDISKDPLWLLGAHIIMAVSSGCMVTRIHEYMGIRLPQYSTLSIHGLWIQGYKIVGYHEIQVPRSNLIFYLLICLILCLDRDMEIISNPVNDI